MINTVKVAKDTDTEKNKKGTREDGAGFRQTTDQHFQCNANSDCRHHKMTNTTNAPPTSPLTTYETGCHAQSKQQFLK